jgi:hypothetical protein
LKISLQATIVIATIFAALCASVAISGFTSLGGITDAVQAADARGFAWFWTFLASVAGVLGLTAWWLVRTHKESDDR